MGGTSWSDDSYKKSASARAATGASAFVYDDAIRKGTAARKVHDKLNPKGVNRESRDSAEHPNSVPIAVLLDVTGSMGSVPITIQKELPKLMGLLIRKGYVDDPQILIGGIGDARSDDAPLQVGQFESGNEIEQDLGNLWLEGGGGGTASESYGLGLYFIARHTATDSWEKRGRKGYLFVIGDEEHYPISRREVADVMGDSIQSDIPIKSILDELSQKWEVFFIIPNLTSYYGNAAIAKAWKDVLGERFLRLDDPKAICELIASTVGAIEGRDVDAIAADLADVGTSAKSIASIGRELAKVGGSKGSVAKISSSGAPSGVATL